MDCAIQRIIRANGGHPLTQVDCQVYCIGQVCTKVVKSVWALLTKDGLGSCTLWNTSMYERHARGGEILALVRVIMQGDTLMIIEESPWLESHW